MFSFSLFLPLCPRRVKNTCFVCVIESRDGGICSAIPVLSTLRKQRTAERMASTYLCRLYCFYRHLGWHAFLSKWRQWPYWRACSCHCDLCSWQENTAVQGTETAPVAAAGTQGLPWSWSVWKLLGLKLGKSFNSPVYMLWGWNFWVRSYMQISCPLLPKMNWLLEFGPRYHQEWISLYLSPWPFANSSFAHEGERTDRGFILPLIHLSIWHLKEAVRRGQYRQSEIQSWVIITYLCCLGTTLFSLQETQALKHFSSWNITYPFQVSLIEHVSCPSSFCDYHRTRKTVLLDLYLFLRKETALVHLAPAWHFPLYYCSTRKLLKKNQKIRFFHTSSLILIHSLKEKRGEMYSVWVERKQKM